MNINFEQLLTKSEQSALAGEIVALTASVVSDAAAPDFAVRTLQQGLSASLNPAQRAAAAALQAYGSKCAGQVLSTALDGSAAERADALEASLERSCPPDALALLADQADAGSEFKAAMCQAIVAKCADLAAAEIERVKNGKITILNEQDQQIFNQQHDDRQEKQTVAIVAFLSSLPERYPASGIDLFDDIERNVQREIAEKYKRPDIHAKVDSLFKDAREAIMRTKQ